MLWHEAARTVAVSVACTFPGGTFEGFLAFVTVVTILASLFVPCDFQSGLVGACAAAGNLVSIRLAVRFHEQREF